MVESTPQQVEVYTQRFTPTLGLELAMRTQQLNLVQHQSDQYTMVLDDNSCLTNVRYMIQTLPVANIFQGNARVTMTNYHEALKQSVNKLQSFLSKLMKNKPTIVLIKKYLETIGKEIETLCKNQTAKYDQKKIQTTIDALKKTVERLQSTIKEQFSDTISEDEMQKLKELIDKCEQELPGFEENEGKFEGGDSLQEYISKKKQQQIQSKEKIISQIQKYKSDQENQKIQAESYERKLQSKEVEIQRIQRKLEDQHKQIENYSKMKISSKDEMTALEQKHQQEEKIRVEKLTQDLENQKQHQVKMQQDNQKAIEQKFQQSMLGVKMSPIPGQPLKNLLSFHLIFILDESGSMDSHKPAVKNATLSLINSRKHKKTDKVTLIYFASSSRAPYLGSPISTDFQILFQSGGTDFTAPIRQLKTAIELTNSDQQPIVIFMTDGAAPHQQACTNLKQIYTQFLDKLMPIWFFGIAFSKYCDMRILREMVQAANGGVDKRVAGGKQIELIYECQDAGSLSKAFDTIGQTVSESLDDVSVLIETYQQHLSKINEVHNKILHDQLEDIKHRSLLHKSLMSSYLDSSSQASEEFIKKIDNSIKDMKKIEEELKAQEARLEKEKVEIQQAITMFRSKEEEFKRGLENSNLENELKKLEETSNEVKNAEAIELRIKNRQSEGWIGVKDETIQKIIPTARMIGDLPHEIHKTTNALVEFLKCSLEPLSLIEEYIQSVQENETELEQLLNVVATKILQDQNIEYIADSGPALIKQLMEHYIEQSQCKAPHVQEYFEENLTDLIQLLVDKDNDNLDEVKDQIKEYAEEKMKNESHKIKLPQQVSEDLKKLDQNDLKIAFLKKARKNSDLSRKDYDAIQSYIIDLKIEILKENQKSQCPQDSYSQVQTPVEEVKAKTKKLKKKLEQFKGSDKRVTELAKKIEKAYNWARKSFTSQYNILKFVQPKMDLVTQYSMFMNQFGPLLNKILDEQQKLEDGLRNCKKPLGC